MEESFWEEALNLSSDRLMNDDAAAAAADDDDGDSFGVKQRFVLP